MKLSYEDHATTSVLTLSGELTVDQSDTFRRACQERLGAGVRDIVLDMQYLTLIDSAGLELLLWLSDEVTRHANGQIRIVKPDETISKIFELTRLDRKFDIYEDVESAAKSLR